MKKNLLTVVLLLSAVFIFAQGTTVVITGQVTLSGTNQPVANQPVMIMSDTFNPVFFYTNTVYTDSSGFYSDYVTVPFLGQFVFTVMTIDCQGMAYVATGVSTNSPIVNNFQIPCGVGSSGNCYSSFTWTASGLTVSFAGTTNSTSSNTVWTWDFGDGTAGSGQNTTHTYAQSGTYLVTLTTVNAAGCTFTYTDLVFAGQNTFCQAAFAVYPDSSLPGYSYTFIDLSIGTVSSWLWDFGDGTTSSLSNPQHTYSQPGVYLICLVISDSSTGCYSTFCDSLLVGFSYCTNSFTWQATGLNVSFSSLVSGTSPYTYQWTFGDGSTSTLPNPVHQYSAGGFYNVTLTTYDATGCAAFSQQFLQVGQGGGNCNALFTAMPDSINQGLFYFINMSTPVGPSTQIISWLWDFGDGTTSTQFMPVHAYNASGYFIVCLTITTGLPGSTFFCTDTYCDSIYVSSGSSCSSSLYYQASGLSVVFTAAGTGTAPFNFGWDLGDGTSATGATVTHTYASAGNYLVQLYMTDANGCFSQSVQNISVSATGNQQLSGQITAGSAAAQLTKVLLMGFNPMTGIITIDTTLTDSSGFYLFSSVPQGIYLLSAEPLPSSPLYLNYAPTYYGNVPYWGSSSVIVLGTAQNPYNISLISLPGPGNGPASLGGFVTNGNIKFSGKGGPAPGVEVMLKSQTGEMLGIRFSDNSGHFSFNNIPYGTYEVYAEVPGLTTIPATVTLNSSSPAIGNISIVVTSSGIVTSLQEGISPGNISIYPNPASDVLYLEITMGLEGQWTLAGIDGKRIQEGNIRSLGNSVIEISTGQLKPGFYVLMILDESGNRISNKVLIR